MCLKHLDIFQDKVVRINKEISPDIHMFGYELFLDITFNNNYRKHEIFYEQLT
jgi:hypothetical protein